MMQFAECTAIDEISDQVRDNDQLRERCARLEVENQRLADLLKMALDRLYESCGLVDVPRRKE